jgi:hypothetical protein
MNDDRMTASESDPRLDPASLRRDIDAQLALMHAVMKQMDALKIYVDSVRAYLSLIADRRGLPPPPKPEDDPRDPKPGGSTLN